MRTKLIVLFSLLAGGLLAWNLHSILLKVPDEASQGAVFRVFYFHFPAAVTSFTLFFIAMFSALVYLRTQNLRYDAAAAAINEVAFAFATITLITGMIWGRIIWGIWWAWDPRIMK
jgi:heme exporter protein C